MTHKKLLLLAAFVALVGSAAVGGGAYARDGSDDGSDSGTSGSGRTATTVSTETETETSTETEVELEDDLTDTQKQKVEQHRSEIKARLETKKAEISEKLAGKRLETCQKRQAAINKILTHATAQNTKQLAVFQKIEQRVKDFYTSKNLTADGYDAAVADADAKEAAAVAAIEASSTVTFDCTAADAAKPGSVIKAAMEARHTALKDYRTSVKDLILVVKKHHGQQTGDSKTDATAETETDTSTEGAQ